MLAGNPNVPKKKFVIVGDGYTGKTCLLFVYVRNEFPEAYVPTVFENQVTDITVDGRSYLLALWDTAGQEDYSRLRPLSYPDTDVVLICYSVDIPDSFENVLTLWVPEVSHYCKGVPILLVGLKTDLRTDKAVIATLDKNGQKPISKLQGTVLAEKINAFAYVECSARNQEGVQEVFELGIRAANSVKKGGFKASGNRGTKQKDCQIL
ncbi:P-loop containing nucleoside triphosphate hydrolase protein [Chytriomyces sp. MP71]|nr:P-loop containing nucleoside triphosphate hydrolase protein [Chytriomyces sp. MP71]